MQILEDLIQQRTKQLGQISETISSLESKSSNQSNQKNFDNLNSVLEGVYDEIDKLVKKKPIEGATDLMVEKVNDIITEAQELITDDSHIEKLDIFVSAGDPPELRDVLFVLRLVNQGMERLSKKLDSENQEIETLLLEATAIKTALEIFQQRYSDGDDGNYHEDYGQIKTDDIEKLLGIKVPNGWTAGNFGTTFNFERLDYIEIEDYFRLS